MAFGVSFLAGGNAVSASSTATSSVTLTSGKLYFLWVTSARNPATVNNPTVSGWTQVSTALDGSSRQRITVFKKDGDGSTGTHTIDYAGQTVDGINWSIDEWTDSLSAASAVVQTNTGTATCTFGSNLASESNAVYHGAVAYAYDQYTTPESGFTLLRDFESAADGNGGVQYRIGSDSTPPTPTLTTELSEVMVSIGLEIAAGGGGGSVAPGTLAFFLNNH